LDYSVLDRIPHADDRINTINPPYIVIGDDTFVQWDTDGEIGFEATITIHVWSVFNGREECKRIQKEIYNLLHNTTLEIEDYKNIGVTFEYADTTLDSDGLHTHGVQRFRLLNRSETWQR
jgi:hypothetical protein